MASEFWGENAKDKSKRVRHFANLSAYYVEKGPTEELEQVTVRERRGQLTFHWPLEFPEVIVQHGGFDAFVGNPPFLGGKRISTEHGDAYERYLKQSVISSKGAADLSCYFLRRAFSALAATGYFGLLTTNSVNEGDSRDVGLTPLIDSGGTIYRAIASFLWPGTANVYASLIHVACGDFRSGSLLNDVGVSEITAFLDSGGGGKPQVLVGQTVLYTQGPTLNGDGLLQAAPAERNKLVAIDPNNHSVIFPYINAKLFNSMTAIEPAEYAISFGTMGLDEARLYAAPFQIVTEHVKPKRDTLTRQVHEARYWLYWDKREAFFASVKNRDCLLVCPIATKHLSFRFLPTDWVFSHTLKLFDIQAFGMFCVLQSSFHEAWARQYSSRLKEDLRYSTSDAFDTFAFPAATNPLSEIGRHYHTFRESLMQTSGEGLTRTYNRFHDLDESTANIQTLRELHAEMDKAVAAVYGWSELDLGHTFHETKQGTRFTISESARREVLGRLLKLNHERYAEEVKQGLHEKKRGARGKPRANKTRRQQDCGETTSWTL